METRARTWTKAILWQALGLVVMTALGWLLTGSAGTGGSLALASTLVGLVTYVVYERVWAGIRWGRLPHDRAA